jgi:hypothetical protein
MRLAGSHGGQAAAAVLATPTSAEEEIRVNELLTPITYFEL